MARIYQFSQNLNRYSYVLNNPLNATDPSGYSWLSKKFKKIGNWFKENWRTVVVAIVVAVLVFTPGGQGFIAPLVGALKAVGISAAVATGAVVGGIAGGLGSALAGGSFKDILRGAVVGAVQGGLTAGLLKGMEPSSFGLDKVFTMESLQHIAGHGIVGGLSSEAMGGKFQDGFISAATSAASGSISFGNNDPILGLAKATILGGTASKLGGDKFSNGASSAAFQYLMSSRGLQAAKIIADDLYTGVKGIIYDKPLTVYKHIANTWSDKNYNKFQKVLRSMTGSIQRILVPTQGPGLGAGIGADSYYTKAQQENLRYEDYQKHIDPNDPKTQNASWKHDFSYFMKRDTTFMGSFRHTQWVIDTYTGKGVEPFVFGQVYRLAGTVAFPMVSVVEAASTGFKR